jgi:hypothetical protein
VAIFAKRSFEPERLTFYQQELMIVSVVSTLKVVIAIVLGIYIYSYILGR